MTFLGIESSNNTNKLSPQEPNAAKQKYQLRSNNTNKLSPQEPATPLTASVTVQIIQINLALKNGVTDESSNRCSNNTNKLSPQERFNYPFYDDLGSNNTNKLSPQEHFSAIQY